MPSLVAAGACLALSAEARTPAVSSHGPVPVLRALRAAQPPKIDGRLDDTVWTQAEAFSTFRQRDPDEGKQPTERTELRLAYDDAALYVGVRMFDAEPARIVRRLSRRDDASDADLFTLYLDPRLDHLTGAQFTVTAAGVLADATIFNDSWDDDSWDAVWEAAVSVDEQGWMAEMRIPLSQLRFSSGEQLTWGVNARRFIQRKNESDWLEVVPKKQSGLASRMAHLEGLDGIKPRTRFEAVPYTVARVERVEPSPGDPFNDGSRGVGGVGVDLKYGLTTNLTLDATVNPDFGQVEVDPAVVNLTQFETFFPEKRPFFIEGAQIFLNFGRNGANNFWGFNRAEPDIFYSRRIGRSPQGAADAAFADQPQATTILGAGKLSGKTASGWSLGLLEAVTAREQARTFGPSGLGRVEVEPLTSYLVGRAHRDLARGGFGVLGTAVLRDLGDPSLAEQLARTAVVTGFDGYYFLDAKKDWAVTGRLAGSWLSGSPSALSLVQTAPQHYFQRPDALRLDPQATSMSGWTGSANLNRQGGHFLVNAALWANSPGFESNDLGFNWQSNRWGGHLVGTFRKTEPDSLTRRRQISIAKWYSLSFDGDRQGDGAHLFANTQLLSYWSMGVNGFKRWRSWSDTLTRGGPTAVSPASQGAGGWLESDSRKRATLSLEGFWTRNEYGGRTTEISSSLNLKPAPWLKLSFGPALTRTRAIAQWVTNVSDPAASATYGGRYVFAELNQTELSGVTRVSWILSPRMSFQLYAQPLFSGGEYTGYKELARPRSFDFLRYGQDLGTIVYDPAAGVYSVDPGGGGAPFSFSNPDFNYKSLRFNAVFRWEYRPGSTAYAVWTQNRVDSQDPGQPDLSRDLPTLLSAPSDNVFLVKLSYRFGR